MKLLNPLNIRLRLTLSVLALAAVLLVPASCFAQSRSGVTDSMAGTIRTLMNAGKGDSIYSRCAPSFQKAVQPQQFKIFIQRNTHALGIVSAIRKAGSLGALSRYILEGARDTLTLLLATDDSDRISGLVMRPFVKKKRAASNNPLASPVDSLVESVVRPCIRQPGTVGISVGIIFNGKWYTYGYGETARGNGRLPDDHTIYEIGSVTKTFTATLLATFVLRGQCRLTDQVNRYLPDSLPVLKLQDSVVTLRMLANHTSGLPRVPADLLTAEPEPGPSDPYARYSKRDLFTYLDSVTLRSVPGRRWSYSNLGFGLLGTVLEEIGHASYGQLVQRYICGPLHMEDTRLSLEAGGRMRFAAGYNMLGKGVPHWHAESMAAAGLLRSTVHDLLLYVQAHFRTDSSDSLSRAFRLCEEPTFHTPAGEIGMAWFQGSRRQFYFHDGGTGGFSSFCAYDPVRDVAVVVLSNSASPVDDAAAQLCRGLDEMQ